MSTTRTPDDKHSELQFKIAFVVSIVTFVLAMGTLIVGRRHLASMGRGGIGGFAVIVYAQHYMCAFFGFGIVSLITGIVAAIRYSTARWYLLLFVCAAAYVVLSAP